MPLNTFTVIVFIASHASAQSPCNIRENDFTKPRIISNGIFTAFTTVSKTNATDVIIYLPYSSQISFISPTNPFHISFNPFHNSVASSLIVLNTPAPSPVVKYSFIVSQLVIINATAATTAATTAVTGALMPAIAAVTAANPVFNAGNSVITFPITTINGANAAATPATITIIFCVSGESDPKAAAISRSFDTIGVITGNNTLPSSVLRLVISVLNDRIEPLAPSASLAACPCAEAVCSIIIARVAACLA